MKFGAILAIQLVTMIVTGVVAVAKASDRKGVGVLSTAESFGAQYAFLKQYTQIVVLSDEQGKAKIAIAPAWQGRVMTSTAEGDSGASFGWINREHIASGKLVPHMNIFGGEERLWLGPEGGQFSIFHRKGGGFTWENWQVPAALDSLPFELLERSRTQADFRATFALENYAGAQFQVEVRRQVRLLDTEAAWRHLKMPRSERVALVGYESINALKNVGTQAWRKESGLISIWIAGMHPASKEAVFIVPISSPTPDETDDGVTSDYFGPLGPDRLKVMPQAIYFRVDAAYQSKIGVKPRRTMGKYGSYNPESGVLTITQFSQTQGVTDYVKSLWRYQRDPYSGDSVNSYNDGPPSPGAAPFGPFYEMESSSPAAALEPGQTIEHTHRTIHLIGNNTDLDRIARIVLGASIHVKFSTGDG